MSERNHEISFVSVMIGESPRARQFAEWIGIYVAAGVGLGLMEFWRRREKRRQFVRDVQREADDIIEEGRKRNRKQ